VRSLTPPPCRSSRVPSGGHRHMNLTGQLRSTAGLRQVSRTVPRVDQAAAAAWRSPLTASNGMYREGRAGGAGVLTQLSSVDPGPQRQVAGVELFGRPEHRGKRIRCRRALALRPLPTGGLGLPARWMRRVRLVQYRPVGIIDSSSGDREADARAVSGPSGHHMDARHETG
jgi:hypothetical protein